MDDEAFLRKAFDVARRARDQGQHPFGAILVDAKGTVLMEQGNAFLQEGHDMTAHAERMIATRASKAWRPPFLAGCTLYSTAEPCAMCAGAIMHARIRRVVFGARDPKTGACGSVVDLFAEQRLNHHTEVTGGVRADEAAKQLSGFFADRRRAANAN